LKTQNTGYIGDSRGSFVSILQERSIFRARWVLEVDVLIGIWTLSQVEGTTNFGKGPKKKQG
jgi:hypothetical protein